MPGKAVYFLAVEGFADWAAAHALAELRRHGGFDVRVTGLTRRAVVSMGGLTVQPTYDLGDVDMGEMAMLIVPGGNCWEQEPIEAGVIDFLRAVDGAAIPIAAICAATTVIVRAGIIRGRRHTSNGLEYLKSHVPAYADSDLYVDTPVVRDRHPPDYGKWPGRCRICARGHGRPRRAFRTGSRLLDRPVSRRRRAPTGLTA